MDRVAEADDPADHAHAEPVQPVERSLQVVDAELRADVLRERHAGRPADLAGFVLQVELDRVDLLRPHEVEDALAELVVGPRVGGHVDRADRSFGAARDDGHRHAPAAPVSRGVGGGEHEAAWRLRDMQLEAAVAGNGHDCRAGEEGRARLERSRQAQRRAAADHGRTSHGERRRGRVDDEAESLLGRAEQAVHAEDDLVRPVREPPGREDDLVALVLRLDRLARRDSSPRRRCGRRVRARRARRRRALPHPPGRPRGGPGRRRGRRTRHRRRRGRAPRGL